MKKNTGDGTPSPLGFAMTLGDKTFPVTVGMGNSGWIATAGAVKDHPFALHGYFKVTEADLYQLQVLFPGKLTVAVDGQTLACQHNDKGWRQFPMALKPGWHSLKIAGTPDNAPTMELNFGAKGVPRLNADRIVRLP
jgi:hypothetical protein